MASQAMTAPYAEQLLSGFDFYKPEIMNTLFRKKGDQGMSYFMLLKSLGFVLPAAQDSYSWFEDRFIHDTFTVDAAGAGGAGAAVTYTIQAGSVNTLASGNDYVYPRQWDRIMFPNEVIGSVLSVAFAGSGVVTIVVRPSLAVGILPAVSAGQELVIVGNAFAEGTAGTTSRLSGTDKYTNYMQIIKEALTVTGSEMTNQDWFDRISGPDGQSILGYMMKGHLDLDYRSALAASTALIFENITTNTNIIDSTSVAANNMVKTTQGLIPAVRARGHVVPYTPGVFSVSSFDNIIKLLDAEFCGSDMLCLNGINLDLEMENALVDYFKDSEISYTVANTFGGDEGLAMSVGFKSLRKGDRRFNFKRMGMFSHPKIGGASGYNFSSMGLVLPIDRRKDPVSGDSLPSIGYRYKKLGAYSREMEMTHISGAGNGLKVISNDLANWHQRQHIGAQAVAANRFCLLDPSA